MIFRHIREIDYDNYVEICPTGGMTLAVQELEPWFFAALKPGDFFEKKIGVAKCHPKENFCKKIGREIATSKAKLRKFTVIKVVDTIGKREVTFEIDGLEEAELVMWKSNKAKKVRLA